jgi:hypothetical protein
MGVIDIVFTVRNTNGTTEYNVNETVLNNTNEIWTQFQFELGFRGFELGNPDFERLAFVAPGNSDAWILITQQFRRCARGRRRNRPPGRSICGTKLRPNFIGWGRGRVAPGEQVTFTFALDIPDSSTIPADFRTGVGYIFTLRHRPLAEPSSWLLACIAFAALTWWQAAFSMRLRSRRSS